MSAAAFRATYSDWRPIMGRSVVRISVEVPIEDSDKAYQVLGGMPIPGSTVWLAVARMADEKKTKQKSYAQEAGAMCASAEFQKFLGATTLGGIDALTEQQAIDWVRHACGVKSRSEIVIGSPALEKWNSIMAEFEIWRRG